MKDPLKTGFAPRLEAAAAAKRALVEKMRPKAAVIDPAHEDRAAIKAAELVRVRSERVAERDATREAAAEAVRLAEAEALGAKREARRERKALTQTEAKAKRDARYAARKARR